MLRTHTCGELRAADAGAAVTLTGWLNRRRDHGPLIFVDLRDRYGMTQVAVDATIHPAAHAALSDARAEYVLLIRGHVRLRPAEARNADLETGEIEVVAEAVEVLNPAKTPPIYVARDGGEEEALRLRYRYIDLRRERMQRNIILRHQTVKFMRDFLGARGFLEIETPMLMASTPEGARDYLVPSRLHPGEFYALPQSPQQLKQLLMVAGIERYFQIARCFRDEDLRADRQPEFTQLDLEMSFVEQENVLNLTEALFTALCAEVTPQLRMKYAPWRRLTYREAIDRYGSDKPDVRFEMELHDLGEVVASSGFGVFDSALEAGGRVFGMAVPGMAGSSRSQTDELTEKAKRAGAKGLVHMSVGADGSVTSPIRKFLGEGRAEQIVEAAGASPGDLVLIVADADIIAQEVLGDLRAELGEKLDLVMNKNELSYVWVQSFPMYKWDADNKRWDATHNPFSGVNPEDEELLVTASGDLAHPSPEDPAGRARALQHDLVLNGWELGGGSIRIHRRELLERSFALQGHSIEGMRDKFGAVLDAFEYGAPPHGGIALGIDRWIALLTSQLNIREVQAFPKTGTGSDLMLGAPSPVEPAQLADLGLQLAAKVAKPPSPP